MASNADASLVSGARFLKRVNKSMEASTPGCSLSLPYAFVDRFGEHMLLKMVLEAPNGKVWDVGLRVAKYTLRLDESGWKEFARDMEIQRGQTLLFELTSKGHFLVYLFGLDGIDLCPHNTYGSTKAGKRKLAEGDDGRGGMENSTPSKKEGIEGTAAFFSSYWEKNALKKKFAMEDRLISIIKSFSSNNPFVIRTMPRTSVEKAFIMGMPKGFARDHMPHDNRDIIIEDPEARFWVVKWLAHRSMFSGGWCSCAENNRLKVNDICIFEIINSQSFIMRMHIYRCEIAS